MNIEFGDPTPGELAAAQARADSSSNDPTIDIAQQQGWADAAGVGPDYRAALVDEWEKLASELGGDARLEGTN